MPAIMSPKPKFLSYPDAAPGSFGDAAAGRGERLTECPDVALPARHPFGIEMFEASSDVGGVPASEIVEKAAGTNRMRRDLEIVNVVIPVVADGAVVGHFF